MFSDAEDGLKLDNKEQFLEFAKSIVDKEAKDDLENLKKQSTPDIEEVRKWDPVLADKMRSIVDSIIEVHNYAKSRYETASSSN
jgi:hypothetical protein